MSRRQRRCRWRSKISELQRVLRGRERVFQGGAGKKGYVHTPLLNPHTSSYYFTPVFTTHQVDSARSLLQSKEVMYEETMKVKGRISKLMFDRFGQETLESPAFKV